MKKWKCSPFNFYLVAAVLFATQVLPAIFGFEIYNYYRDWHKLPLGEGVFITLLSLFLVILGKKMCIEPIIYKCPKCKKVFLEKDVKNGQCPDCLIDMIDINDYYKNDQE